MDVKEKLKERMAVYGIEEVDVINPRTMCFGYDKGISEKYVNKELRKKHREYMRKGITNE